MPASFLHGVEIQEFESGPVPIQLVPTGIIGLIGTAPSWAVAAPAVAPAPNVPTLVSSGYDAAKFGPLIQGYTIPHAIEAVQDQGAGQLIVVNVFDPTKHYTDIDGSFTLGSNGALTLGHMGISNLSVMPPTVVIVSAEAHTFVGTPGTINLAHAFLVGATVVVTAVGGTPVYVENTDYTVDYRTGVITRIVGGAITAAEPVLASYHYYSGTPYVLNTDYTADLVNGVIALITGGALTNGESVICSFSYADPSKVQDSDIIGSLSAYTGIYALQITYGTMGFFAKMIIAPGFSKDAGVATQMIAMAGTIRAMALIDSPPSTAVATAIANRGVPGNPFDTSSPRAILCFPQQKFYDTGLIPTGVTVNSNGVAVTAAANANGVHSFSPWVAGAIASKDLSDGYWWSPSNTLVNGILGPDVPIYVSPIDPNSDTNNLNAAGIVTVLNDFATGLRVWGNRSAAWPSETFPENFICVRRTMDIIEESIQLAMMQFIDQPISNGLISTILASVNSFLRTLIQQGALVGGVGTYDPAANPPTQIAAGQLVFNIDCMPPPPAERLTFNITIDTALLAAIGQTTPSATLA